MPGSREQTEEFTNGVMVMHPLSVTVNEHAAVLPAPSVAVQSTTVVLFENVEPESGSQVSATPGQLSAAVGEKFTTAPA
jgi:hypothetical protein